MKKTFWVLLLFFAFFSNAQIKFEKGYVITNDGEKKEVLIKNMDWVVNPTEITYKAGEESPQSTGTPANLKEFGIYGYSKYVTYKGDIDYSTDDLSNLSAQYAPEFKQSTVFLKEIASGDKNLYSYSVKSTVNYLYSDSSGIQPLIYKKYNPEGNASQVATNDTYISQLKTIFKDDSNAQSLVSLTKYNKNSLTKIFNAHNQKTGSSSDEFQAEKKTTKFNLSVRPGVNFYSTLETDKLLGSNGFPSKTNFRIGIEAELVLPFNKNKWSIIFEPNYSAYTSEKITTRSGDQLYNITMDSYSLINLPLGIRHYMFLSPKSKLFIDGQANILTLRSGKAKAINFDYDGTFFDKADLASSQALDNFTFGAGYTYNNKYTVELKYTTSNHILDKNTGSTAKMTYTSIILGYNIF